MFNCYWNLKTHKWDTEHYECNTLASQLMFRYSPKGKSIGFHCQDNEVNKYVDKLKKNEIKEREKEIRKLQIELENIKRMEYPILK